MNQKMKGKKGVDETPIVTSGLKNSYVWASPCKPTIQESMQQVAFSLKNAFLHKGFIHSSAKNFCEEFHRGIWYARYRLSMLSQLEKSHFFFCNAIALFLCYIIFFLSYFRIFPMSLIHISVGYNSSKMYQILLDVGIYTSSFSGYEVKQKKRQNSTFIT